MSALFHGGKPDLRAGDLIEPGHERNTHDGCPWCEARTQGDAHLGMDGPSKDTDRVYCTTNRLYAKHYASLWGRGDLYRVEPVGELVPSTEDTVESFKAPALRVAAVLDRAVLLTNSERRRLFREWGAADQRALTAQRKDNPLAQLDQELEDLLEAERALKARAFGLPFITDDN